MHWLDVLLPYLVGAATALVVQLVVQLYVVPRVETRKRREDRWERNVLELAELLATDVAKSASEAKVAQWVCLDLRVMAADPSADRDKFERRLPGRLTEARHATSAFYDLATIRVRLLTSQIERFSPEAEDLGRFSAAVLRHRMAVAFVALWDENEDPSDAELDKRWDQEYEARVDLVDRVTRLAELPLPAARPSASSADVLKEAGASQLR